jgi:hypothetical protein
MSELLHAIKTEQAAYRAYIQEQSPRIGRVYPSRVNEARKAWYSTLVKRNTLLDAEAQRQGVTRTVLLHQVLGGEG